MPVEHRNYFNELAFQWDSIADNDLSLKDYLIKFNVSKGDKILDTGAGTGRISRLLWEITGDEGLVITHDFAIDMLKYGRNSNLKKRIIPVCNDAHFLSFKDNFFDKIICFSAFPHFLDQYRVLTEMYRVLKSGGKFLILHTSSSKSLNEFHKNLGTVVHRDVLPDSVSMSAMLKVSGFKVLKAVDKENLYWVEGLKA